MLGIDLGASFCTAAVLDEGQIFVLTNEKGDPAIPSAIALPARGSPLVGEEAQHLAQREPQHLLRGLRQILGRPFDSNEVRLFDAQSPIKLSRAPNGAAVLLTRDGPYTATELVAHLFSYLRHHAEERLRLRVEDAVITVPPAAPAEVKVATAAAARNVGLQVIATPSDAVAALHLSPRPRNHDRRVLVLDVGAATFAASVLLQTPQGLEVLAQTRDPFLGGDDFDLSLAKGIADRAWRAAQIDLAHDVVRWDRLLMAAERAKRALSAGEQTALSIPGPEGSVQLLLQRKEAEQWWQPLLHDILEKAAHATFEAGLRPPQLDEVWMVGGSSRIPALQQAMARLFARPPLIHGDPQTVVARGAAAMGNPKASPATFSEASFRAPTPWAINARSVRR